MEMYVMDALVKLRSIYLGNGSGYIIHLIYAFLEPFGRAKEVDKNRGCVCAITKNKSNQNDFGTASLYGSEINKMFASDKSDAIISYPVLIALSRFVQEQIDLDDARIQKIFALNKPITKKVEALDSSPLPIIGKQEWLRVKYAEKIERIQSL